MDLQIQLSRKETVYSSNEAVSGQLVLRSAIPLQISSIVVTLKGTATSSLREGRLVEYHELFRRRQRVFPPPAIAQLPGHPGLTVGAGTHHFPFSIPFSQVSECYKMNNGEAPEVTCSSIRRPRTPIVHLLRRLPPSTGAIGTSGEIQYTLDAEVTPGGHFKRCERASCAIAFRPLSDPLPLQPPSKQIQAVTMDPDVLGTTQSVSFHVEVRLSQGPCLLRGHPIPLEVAPIRVGPASCSVRLEDFQTMLVETTQVRVQEGVEHLAQVWVVQTVANMGRSVAIECSHRPAWVSNDLWSGHSLPERATSSFETCNLRRTHRLEVRLGFRFQASPMLPSRLVVFDFRFPIYLMSASLTQSPIPREKIGFSAHEDALYKEAALDKTAVFSRAVEVEDNRCLSIKD